MHYKNLIRYRSKTITILNIAMLALGVLFAVSAVNTLRLYSEDRRAERSYELVRQQMHESVYQKSSLPFSLEVDNGMEQLNALTAKASEMDFSLLKAQNDDVVAWLLSDGTSIDYPVLHGEDNEYYLKHLYTGENNRAGSLFVDYRNTGLFTDKNTVIYGHNMTADEMFHSLSGYKAQEYYDAFPTMYLFTPDGDYTIEIVCGTVEDGNYEFVRFNFESDEDFMEYVSGFQTRSTFVSNIQIEPTDQLVTLCTCSYERNNARYVLIGRLLSR